jgi:hypothetical protein
MSQGATNREQRSERGPWLVPASKLGAAAEMAAVPADGAGEHCQAQARGLPRGLAGTLVPGLTAAPRRSRRAGDVRMRFPRSACLKRGKCTHAKRRLNVQQRRRPGGLFGEQRPRGVGPDVKLGMRVEARRADTPAMATDSARMGRAGHFLAVNCVHRGAGLRMPNLTLDSNAAGHAFRGTSVRCRSSRESSV